MRAVMVILPMILAAGCARYANHLSPEEIALERAEYAKRRYDEAVFKSLGDLLRRMHLVATKRCATIMDEGCSNGGVPGSGSDEDWINNNGLGKRCANLMDEGCNNGGIPGGGSDEDWINHNGLGKKRCANLMDEGCNNGGIPGGGSDEDWIDHNGLGKRNGMDGK